MGMDDRDPTIRSRELGERLRQHMERKGLSGNAVAEAIGSSQGQVSKLLSGKRLASEANVAAILALCGVTGQERDTLLTLCHDLGRPGWLQKYPPRLPKQIRTPADHEDSAVNYSDFHPVAIPGLLQTPEYARAWLECSGTVPPEEVSERVNARIERNRIFDRKYPANFLFLIHESVLHSPVGSSEVMSEQLHHLIRMGVRDHVSIRVIPIAVGAHAGPGGAFKLMEFANLRPLVYLEGEITSLFLEEPREIQAYRSVLAALWNVTLDHEASRELISRVAIERFSTGEDDDDRLAQEQPQ